MTFYEHVQYQNKFTVRFKQQTLANPKSSGLGPVQIGESLGILNVHIFYGVILRIPFNIAIDAIKVAVFRIKEFRLVRHIQCTHLGGVLI